MKEKEAIDSTSEKVVCNKIDTVMKKGKVSLIKRKERRAGNAPKKILS